MTSFLDNSYQCFTTIFYYNPSQELFSHIFLCALTPHEILIPHICLDYIHMCFIHVRIFLAPHKTVFCLFRMHALFYQEHEVSTNDILMTQHQRPRTLKILQSCNVKQNIFNFFLVMRTVRIYSNNFIM